jgi:hypothetical protein
MYSDDQAAALYEVLNPWAPGDDFYLALVMDAPSVLESAAGRERCCTAEPTSSGWAARRRRWRSTASSTWPS